MASLYLYSAVISNCPAFLELRILAVHDFSFSGEPDYFKKSNPPFLGIDIVRNRMVKFHFFMLLLSCNLLIIIGLLDFLYFCCLWIRCSYFSLILDSVVIWKKQSYFSFTASPMLKKLCSWNIILSLVM